MPHAHVDHSGHDHTSAQDAAVSDAVETATDPVRGMNVPLDGTRRSATHAGQTFHFCGAKCHDRFQADPYFYASGNSKRHKDSAATKALYTCPMHPEIEQEGPGTCPKCGMALEPLIASADDAPNEELTDFTRRLWIAAAAAIPLIVLSMGQFVGLPVRGWIGEPLVTYIEFILATPVVLWVARPFFARGLASVQNRSPNMWTLISLG